MVCVLLFADKAGPERCLQAGLQLMWVHLQSSETLEPFVD
jgi:hypothetical protein